ncbi:MAG TPA: ATPase, partial [Clostridiales bacterium]|nr:ATPase [Clostridiales bacterium]
MYIRRHMENVLDNPAFLRGVMAVTGSRQTGKSTLIHELLKDKPHSELSLDDIVVREHTKTDPKVFLSKHPAPLFIDEIQYAAELFPYLKIHIDKTHEKGAFYISGSQRF